jgi:hypothetical protein
MYITINAAIGGIGGGTPSGTFLQTFQVDYVALPSSEVPRPASRFLDAADYGASTRERGDEQFCPD